MVMECGVASSGLVKLCSSEVSFPQICTTFPMAGGASGAIAAVHVNILSSFSCTAEHVDGGGGIRVADDDYY